MKQKDIFLQSEGDRWFERNKKGLDENDFENDLILNEVVKNEIAPQKILEVGCSNGFRLEKFRKKFNSQCYGIEPSEQALEDGKKYKNIKLVSGTAVNLPFEKNEFDLVYFGFSLYLCDREDMFRIAAEADRVLKDGGHMLIYDFYSPVPYKNVYTHKEGISSYKMNNASMFLWNPCYSQIYFRLFSSEGKKWGGKLDDTCALQILRKYEKIAYVDNPYQEK